MIGGTREAKEERQKVSDLAGRQMPESGNSDQGEDRGRIRSEAKTRSSRNSGQGSGTVTQTLGPRVSSLMEG